jgi:hypothetical protein
MGGVCSAHGGLEMRTKVWSESLRGRDHSDDLDGG